MVGSRWGCALLCLQEAGCRLFCTDSNRDCSLFSALVSPHFSSPYGQDLVYTSCYTTFGAGEKDAVPLITSAVLGKKIVGFDLNPYKTIDGYYCSDMNFCGSSDSPKFFTYKFPTQVTIKYISVAIRKDKVRFTDVTIRFGTNADYRNNPVFAVISGSAPLGTVLDIYAATSGPKTGTLLSLETPVLSYWFSFCQMKVIIE